MAQYNGFVSVPHNTYEDWRNATLGNGYDVDYSFGNQCWDYCDLLYAQYGKYLVTKSGGGTAKDCWLVSKNVNSTPPFEAVEGKQNIKRGDIIVLNGIPENPAGHICFADEDYNGTDRIAVVQQNGFQPTTPVHTATCGLDQFLGIFRNTLWQGVVPPEPESSYNKHRYNFVLFNRRKRQEKWTRKPLNQRSKNSVL